MFFSDGDSEATKQGTRCPSLECHSFTSRCSFQHCFLNSYLVLKTEDTEIKKYHSSHLGACAPIGERDTCFDVTVGVTTEAPIETRYHVIKEIRISSKGGQEPIECLLKPSPC